MSTTIVNIKIEIGEGQRLPSDPRLVHNLWVNGRFINYYSTKMRARRAARYLICKELKFSDNQLI